MSKVHIASCACGWVGEAEGGTQIVNYFCPKCGTGKYLVSIGDYYPAAEVDAYRAKVLKIFKSFIDYEPNDICKDDFAYDRLLANYKEAAKAAMAALEAEDE